ncbi:host attachment protein [Rhizobium grahamii]|uniref:Host attachment protein n=1 Tax=Rhizobium grahamii TaxID=1120045 RepID=A0A5Q0C5J4_9HYPH|nr:MULTISPECIES: host attachment family protein [Rhizobium]QFY59554.1 host attachment protein [Rhizobium grahamii]QRM47923.1 host attachment protein [Rhizobium sp. BG6]
MADISFPREAWIVVCDGGKALIMQNAGNAFELNLKVKETLSQPNDPDRKLGTDKPGRTHAADGLSGSAMEETDWHERAEVEFLKQVATKMDALVRKKDARHIVVVAPPQALGTLRSNFTADTRAAIAGELAKDYINLPIDQIEQHLAA